MSSKSRATRTPTRKRATRLVRVCALFALATLVVALSTGSAQATLSPGSTFQGNDGNMIVDPGSPAGATDWASLSPNGTPALHTATDVASGSSDNAFGQGTKEDSPNATVVDGSIPPNKNDLTHFMEASELSSNNGDTYLYLGWERAVNIGNANLDFEINQNATAGFTGSTTGPVTLNRTAGDLLVTYDFGGSGTPTLGLNTWLTAAAGNTVGQCYSANSLPCWGKHIALNGSDSEGAVNTVGIVDSVFGGNLGVGLFGEAAIDLTAAGVFPPGTCTAFGSAFLKSRSSSSFTAELKDFIAPIKVNINNCGTIKVTKVTENAPSGDTTAFSYSTTSSGTALSPATFTLTNGQTQQFTNVPQGTYTIAEPSSALPAGWDFVGLSCDVVAGGPSTTQSVTGATATIGMSASGEVDCTYTNHFTNSPTISTTLSTSTANIGDSVHDSATLHGATANAGGSVTYHAYAGANTCPADFTGDLLNSKVTVTNGVVPQSAPITFTAAGTYSFQAVYSGDANNNSATSVCSTEQLLVKSSPSITTTLSATSVDVGSSVNDSAKLKDATVDAGGTVTYHAYAGADTCTGTDLLNDTETVTNGVVPDSKAITLTTAGTYSFQAVYSGDTKNNGATSVCSSEQLTVNPLQPTASTAQDLLPNDSFTLSGGYNPTGTITFGLYSPSDATCSGSPAYSLTVTVGGNGTYSTTNTTFHATTAGTWRWMSSYSGDNNNLPATSACGVENFTIDNGPNG